MNKRRWLVIGIVLALSYVVVVFSFFYIDASKELSLGDWLSFAGSVVSGVSTVFLGLIAIHQTEMAQYSQAISENKTILIPQKGQTIDVFVQCWYDKKTIDTLNEVAFLFEIPYQVHSSSLPSSYSTQKVALLSINDELQKRNGITSETSKKLWYSAQKVGSNEVNLSYKLITSSCENELISSLTNYYSFYIGMLSDAEFSDSLLTYTKIHIDFLARCGQVVTPHHVALRINPISTSFKQECSFENDDFYFSFSMKWIIESVSFTYAPSFLLT